MKVSLLLTSKNEERHVGQFFEYLKSQTRKPDETVLVDSSDDRTPEMAKPLVDRLICEPTRNCGHARKIGFEHCTGDIIVLTDLDCRLKKDWLEEIVRPFSDPDVHVVQGQVLFYSLDKEESQMWSSGLPKEGKYTNHCNIAFRRHVIEEHPWDPKINLDDVEMGYKINKKYTVHGQKTAVVQHFGATPESGRSFDRILKYHVGYMQLLVKYKRDALYWWLRAWYNIFYLIRKRKFNHFMYCFAAMWIAVYMALRGRI